MPVTSKYVMESREPSLANNHINHKVIFSLIWIKILIFLTSVMHIISVTDFPLFCSNYARTYSARNSAWTPKFCSNYAWSPKNFRPFGPYVFHKYGREPGPNPFFVIHIKIVMLLLQSM